MNLSEKDENLIAHLKQKAVQIRKMLLKLAYCAGSLHLGGDLSMTDMMVGAFYHAMRHKPLEPNWEDRDRFVLSKGHGAGCLYAVLADQGYFPAEELWEDAGKPLTHFGTHPCKGKVPGIEVSTGSLGHGLSIAVGMALAARFKKQTHRILTLIGDGESQEGSIWEAAMAAASYQLDNLICLVDRNRLSLDGWTEDLMALEPLDKKWEAFGWRVIKIDGNDMEQVIDALIEASAQNQKKPTVILGYTTKGKGIPFMENDPKWHSGTVDAKMLEKCCECLELTDPQN